MLITENKVALLLMDETRQLCRGRRELGGNFLSPGVTGQHQLPACGGTDAVPRRGDGACAEENDLMSVERLFIYKGLKMTSIEYL